MQSKKETPTLYIVAGCNGVGKSTSMRSMLPRYLGSEAFVNADDIAAEITPELPTSAAIAAGRATLHKIDGLVLSRSTFVIETTLSGKGYQNLIANCKQIGYKVVLIFFWLSSVELAIDRIRDRVQEGGHFIAEDIVRRRYNRGIRRFFRDYAPLCHSWKIIENSFSQYCVVAYKDPSTVDIKIENHEFWRQINHLAFGNF